MPTDAPKDLYNPDLAAVAVQPLAERAHRALGEVIRQGSAILARCIAEVEHRDENPTHDHHLAVFISFHHVLEMLDSANESLATGRSIGSRPTIRSAFEALLALEYMLRDPELLETRGYLFLVADVFKRIADIERFTPGTDAWKEFEDARAADRGSAGTSPPTFEGGAASTARLRSVLEKPRWKEAAVALDVERARDRWAPWYSANGGPRNIRKLAWQVGRPYQYALLYDLLSATSHAKDASRILGHVDGQLGIATIPNWTWTRTGYSFALNIGLAACRQVLGHYRGEREFYAKWYTEEIRAAALEVSISGIE